MLDCFLAASCTCNDLNLYKSSSIHGQLVHNHCILVFSFIQWLFQCSKILWFFLIHVEMFLGTPYFSVTSLFERPFSSSLKAWHFSPKLFTLSCRLTEDMLLPERMLKRIKNKLPKKILSMQLLTFEYLKWTVWFIRKLHSNVRDSRWETVQKLMKGPRKLFDTVKVRDSGVRDTERIYKVS